MNFIVSLTLAFAVDVGSLRCREDGAMVRPLARRGRATGGTEKWTVERSGAVHERRPKNVILEAA